MFDKKVSALVLLVVFSVAAIADTVTLRPDHPDRYTVVKGDTLWDISDTFLEDPWNWPRIWHINQQIANPHLIYPGDVLRLVYIDGKPQLILDRGTVKLSPKVRETPIDDAITTIPLDAIRQFLSRNRMILTEEEFDKAPYVVDMMEQRLMASVSQVMYVRAVEDGSQQLYSVYRKGQAYKDPESGEVLGYEAIYTGDAQLNNTGDPARLTVVNSNREILAGDRLFDYRDDTFDPYFTPRPPENEVEAQIISVVDGLSEIGQYQTVVINVGETQSMRTGDVLAVWQKGPEVRDTVAGKGTMVTLPDEHAGHVIVYKTFENVSYALVVNAERAMHVNDVVRNP
jgi:hypothetical protein